jgi:hypothetical protein
VTTAPRFLSARHPSNSTYTIYVNITKLPMLSHPQVLQMREQDIAPHLFLDISFDSLIQIPVTIPIF